MAKTYLEGNEFQWAASILVDWADTLEESGDIEKAEDTRKVARRLDSYISTRRVTIKEALVRLADFEYAMMVLWQELSD